MSRAERQLRQELRLLRDQRDEYKAMAERLLDDLRQSQAQVERLLAILERP